MDTATGLEKIDRIAQLLADVSWIVGHMLEDGLEDKHYKNLGEVISYLETAKCVLNEKSLEYYLERVM